MIPSPRQRAANAFAIIDRHHADDQSSTCPMFAYIELAAAMTELFGSLPDERLHAAWAQIEREVET